MGDDNSTPQPPTPNAGNLINQLLGQIPPLYLIIAGLMLGGGGAGFGGVITRDGDLSAVQAMIDRAISTAHAEDASNNALIVGRLELILQRVEDLERKLDRLERLQSQ